MPPETDSDTLTPESIATQIIQENQGLAREYAAGDMAALSLLQDKALALVAGRLSEQDVRDTLMRKLGASI